MRWRVVRAHLGLPLAVVPWVVTVGRAMIAARLEPRNRLLGEERAHRPAGYLFLPVEPLRTSEILPKPPERYFDGGCGRAPRGYARGAARARRSALSPRRAYLVLDDAREGARAAADAHAALGNLLHANGDSAGAVTCFARR